MPRPRSGFDLLEEAGLEQLLAVYREERVDRIADHAHDLAFAPGRVADDIALLERPEHRALYALDLERAAAAGGVTPPHRFFEELLARHRIPAAARDELLRDQAGVARRRLRVLGGALAVVAGSAGRSV